MRIWAEIKIGLAKVGRFDSIEESGQPRMEDVRFCGEPVQVDITERCAHRAAYRSILLVLHGTEPYVS